MEQIGFVAGIAALVWCYLLNEQLSKMRRMLRDAGLGVSDIDAMRNISLKNKGRTGVIEFYEGEEETELLSKECVILECDDAWVLVELEKKKIRKLIRISSIKTLTFRS